MNSAWLIAGGGVITAITALVYALRKSKPEAADIVVNATVRLMDRHEKYSDELEERVDRLQARIELLEAQLAEKIDAERRLMAENDRLRLRVAELERKVEQLESGT